MRVELLLKRYRLVVYIVAAALAMVFFTYLTPPIFEKSVFSFFNRLKGDYPVYLSRFVLSFGLLGVFPFVIALLCGHGPTEMGFSLKLAPFRWYQIGGFLAVAVLAGVIGGKSESLAAYYPYSQTLVEDCLEKGWHYFFLHSTLYAVLYYLPWEFFFRGFLMLLFIHALEANRNNLEKSDQYRSILWCLIAFQTIPSTLLHFGHPVSELLSAIPAGVFFAWVVYKTRSLLPALLLHVAVGIATDATIILGRGGTV